MDSTQAQDDFIRILTYLFNHNLIYIYRYTGVYTDVFLLYIHYPCILLRIDGRGTTPLKPLDCCVLTGDNSTAALPEEKISRCTEAGSLRGSGIMAMAMENHEQPPSICCN